MKKLLLWAILILGTQAALKSCGIMVGAAVEKRDTLGTAMLKSLAEGAENLLYGQFMPGILLAGREEQGIGRLLREQTDTVFPLYGYMAETPAREPAENEADYRVMTVAEAEEGRFLPESGSASDVTAPDNPGTESIEELLRAENEAAMQLRQVSSFIPHTKMNSVDLDALQDYETLLGQFYIVDATTTASGSELNVDRLLEKDMRISGDGEGPQILIYHTHSQEAFADSRPGERADTIMGAGDRLTEILTEEYGYRVLHHSGMYDIESRDGSYEVALPEIEELLREYPSIEVVIDLHRDAMPEGTRLVMDLDGRPTARFMFFNGLSRTKRTGNIAYLQNDNLEDNLAFSFQMQLKAMEYYPGLTRRIYLKGYRYNMHLCPKYLLIEMGAQNNTVEEIMNACDPLAHILNLVLSGEE